ncbi:GAF domain-containing protein [Pararhizobium sp. IMCC21322]|uniref:GAF domain-containing sensor histidine kinase n=1 Tax=Pararhizobium sp. IMCC21322 TaxID=3067903 RepID=UPI002741D5E1|nr:GAF domain-containing protein [Pararhizobium sp. IMCC21322]
MQTRVDHTLDHYLAISRAVAGQMDFKAVLHQIAGEVQNIVPYDHMDVVIISPDNTDCHVSVEVGVATKWGDDDESRPIMESPIRDLLTGDLDYILSGDAWEDPSFHITGHFSAPIFEADLHSRIHVPLLVHGKIHGSLNISRHKKNAYDEDDLAAAKNIADLISPYFYALSMGERARKLALSEGSARGREETLRSGALRLTEGMEYQRKRLGMELHDQTLGDLSRIYRQMTTLSRRSKVTAAEIAGIGDAIGQCMGELRRIIENAKPGVLDLFGLQQAIEAQLAQTVEGIVPKIAYSVSDETEGALDHAPEMLRTSVFRVCQEAVNNAVYHGHCRNLNVAIVKNGDSIDVSISNDGVKPPVNWAQSTRGIDNMRVRAALISGKISFERMDGLTVIRLTVPGSYSVNPVPQLLTEAS